MAKSRVAPLRPSRFRTVSIWNSMDSSLKTLEKVSAFKFYLKRKLIKDFIDS